MSTKKYNNELVDVLESGIDLKNRKIFYGKVFSKQEEDGALTWLEADTVVRSIHILASNDSKKPIELHINCCGGDPDAMSYLIDTILACSCQIKFYGGGTISSAATWIMAVCDERYLHKNTRLCFHDSGMWAIEGKKTDLQINIEEENRFQDRLEQMFADNSYMPKKFWADILRRDCWLTADEAVSLGIADEVIEHKKRGNLRKVRIAKMAANMDKKKITKVVKSIYSRTYNEKGMDININMPEEKCDPNIVIDNTPSTPSIEPVVTEVK